VRGFRQGVWTGFATLDRVQSIGNKEFGFLIQGSATFGGFPQGGGRITACLAPFNGGPGFVGLPEASSRAQPLQRRPLSHGIDSPRS
jgi:hypothetical protein